MPDPIEGCGDVCDFVLMVSEPALATGESGTATTILANGTLETIDIELNWMQVDGSGAWPGDMLVEVGLPDGNCFAFGRFNLGSSTCDSLGNYAVVWPEWTESEACIRQLWMCLLWDIQARRLEFDNHQWLDSFFLYKQRELLKLASR